jgi:acyl carrier protein
MFELEDAFGFPIPQESVAHVRTLRELAMAVDELIVTKSAAAS